MNRKSAMRLVEQYFDSWKRQDLALFLSTLSPATVVTESYGPVYCGTDELRDWFSGWHASPNNGKVTQWEIINFIFDETKNMAAVEWNFECVSYGNTGSFPGSSLFYYYDTKIMSIREYRMEKDRYRPYSKG